MTEDNRVNIVLYYIRAFV